MLDFVHLRSWDIASSPIGRELDRLGVPHRFITKPVEFRYQRRVDLLLRVYPRLFLQTTRAAWQSLFVSRPKPSTVVISSDVEALVFALFRRLCSPRTIVVFQTLIITPRQGRLANVLYMLYWRLILAAIDVGICHSRAEVDTYVRRFPSSRRKLVYIPFGTTVDHRHLLERKGPVCAEQPVLVTAGRSGRDYATLVQAIAGLPCKLIIICDTAAPLAGIELSEQVEVKPACFDDDYLWTLAQATAVVVPLSVNDISAGQMVFLQAAAFGRAIVITETETTVDYATDEVDALLVSLGDVAAMRQAVTRLLDDPVLRETLGMAAAKRFVRNHSTEAYIRTLMHTIEDKLPAPAV